MSINQTVLGALEPILNNTWAVELPPSPTWPAAVFEVDTEEEKGWAQGGGYDQHLVAVVIMARDLDQITTLRSQFREAMEAVAGYMGLEGEGDGEYEDDPDVYAYYMNFRIRERR